MVTVERDVVFAQGSGRDLRLDIYRPAASGADDRPATAVLMWHGGGWRMGDRGRVAAHARSWAELGLVVLSAEYRLNGEALWPAQIEDTKAAIRWTRANSHGLGIDPQKIAGAGFSAGAHLALMAAGTPDVADFEGEGGHAETSSALGAVVAVFPPVLLFVGDDRPSGGSPAAALVPGTDDAHLATEASPIRYVTAAFPPTFLLHGTNDRVVPVSATLRMGEALRAAGAPVETHLYHDQPHGFSSFPGFVGLIAAEASNFLERNLGDPEGWERSAAEYLAAQEQEGVQAAAAGSR